LGCRVRDDDDDNNNNNNNNDNNNIGWGKPLRTLGSK
jgi:hypothetical protein